MPAVAGAASAVAVLIVYWLLAAGRVPVRTYHVTNVVAAPGLAWSAAVTGAYGPLLVTLTMGVVAAAKLATDAARRRDVPSTGDDVRPLGWWAISGEALLDMLRRAHAGEDPDVVYAEEYANGTHEYPDG